MKVLSPIILLLLVLSSCEFVPRPLMKKSPKKSIMERIGETKEAEFPGGNKAIRGWLMENVRYPDEALEMGLQGRVFVRFVIDRNGQVTNARTFSSADTILELEALRVVKSMPRWKPATRNGKPIPSIYNLPISFRI